MNHSFFIAGFFLILITAFLFSCNQKSDQEAVQALIDVTVEERLTKYREIREEKCEERVLEEASRLADSILIAQARLARDTISKPLKPLKPENLQKKP